MGRAGIIGFSMIIISLLSGCHYLALDIALNTAAHTLHGKGHAYYPHHYRRSHYHRSYHGHRHHR